MATLRASVANACGVRLLRGFGPRKIGLYRCGTDSVLISDAREVSVFVPMHLHRRKEFSVIIFHGESEARPLVVLNHLGVIAAVNSRRARHATGPVVVGGDRKRPVAERVVVGAEQLG